MKVGSPGHARLPEAAHTRGLRAVLLPDHEEPIPTGDADDADARKSMEPPSTPRLGKRGNDFLTAMPVRPALRHRTHRWSTSPASRR